MKVLPYICKRADPKSSHPGTPGAGHRILQATCTTSTIHLSLHNVKFPKHESSSKSKPPSPPNFQLEMHPISSTNCTNFQWKFTPISSTNSTDFQCKFQRKGHRKAAQCQNLPHFPATTNIPLNTNKSQNLYNNCKNTIQSCYLMEFTLQY